MAFKQAQFHPNTPRDKHDIILNCQNLEGYFGKKYDHQRSEIFYGDRYNLNIKAPFISKQSNQPISRYLAIYKSRSALITYDLVI